MALSLISSNVRPQQERLQGLSLMERLFSECIVRKEIVINSAKTILAALQEMEVLKCRARDD